MTPSLLLTNLLFCGLASILLLPLLKRPNILTYKRGIPIFSIMGIVLLKFLVPHEFPFTRTLASKNVLPILRNIFYIKIIQDITLGNILLWIWILISILLFCYLILQYQRLNRIIRIVPEDKDMKIDMILSELCSQKKIKKKPSIIQLDAIASPFIIGFRSPVLVLPIGLSKDEIRLVLMHELEHLVQNHLLIKKIVEIIAILYWWNPIIWLLRKEILCSLELQADMNVIGKLSKEDGLIYLETLINISKRGSQKVDNNLALSFALKSNILIYRVSTILKSKYFQKKKNTFIPYIGLSFLSITLLLFSIMYTFEPYYPLADTVDNIFTINAETDYFIAREGKWYDLYINEKYIKTFNFIPDDFSVLPIY